MRIFIICLSLVAFLTGSCSKEDTNKKIDFYKNQARDKNILGKWKKELTTEEGYVIDDFRSNGEFHRTYYYPKKKEEKKDNVAYFYTKEGVCYILRTGTGIKVADQELKYKYEISDNTLYLSLDNEKLTPAVRVK